MCVSWVLVVAMEMSGKTLWLAGYKNTYASLIGLSPVSSTQ